MRTRAIASSTVRWLALLLVVVVSVAPVLMVILSSFKIERDIFTFVPRIFFRPTLDNFRALLRDWPGFLRSLRLSFLITLSSSLFVVLISLPGAYSYSRLRVRGLSVTAWVLIVARMFPPIVITIPLYPIFWRLGITDTPIGLILVYGAFEVSMATMLLKTFIDGIAVELEEQAQIDGCSRLQGFLRVVLPLMLPGIIAVVIFVSMFTWNDFVFAFLLTGIRTKTAPIMIAELLGLVGQSAINWGTIFAASVLQFLPILLFVWVVQKRLVGGFAIGAVKE